MRIGIYCEVAKGPQPTGIGYHIRELVSALGKLDRENEYLLYVQSDMSRSPTAWEELPSGSNFRLRPVRFPQGWQSNRPRLWWEHYLPWLLRRDRLDVFHGPNHFAPRFVRERTIVTFHDLAYFWMEVHGSGQDEVIRQWTRKALQEAGTYIALSENTRRDIEQIGGDPQRIHVIYGGGRIVPENEVQTYRIAELRRQYDLSEKYVLFVGTIQPRKNVPFLLRAFSELCRTTTLPHKLVLAGHNQLAVEIDRLLDELSIRERTIIMNYVEQWQIPLLYKLADVFVLPTKYEGFGMVSLEAMAYGVPVIATDSSSVREVVGEAALLVNVNDVKGLSHAIQIVLNDEQLQVRLKNLGFKQAKKFTWEECARRTLKLYSDVVQGSSSPHSLRKVTTRQKATNIGRK